MGGFLSFGVLYMLANLIDATRPALLLALITFQLVLMIGGLS